MSRPIVASRDSVPQNRSRHAVDHADIADRDDIEALLRDFYGRAFRDELLGPVFVEIAQMNLEEHLPVMCDFWETALFRAGTYRRNALQPHLRLHRQTPLTSAHFARWLALWRATVDERHFGPKADLAKLQAGRIAESMSKRLTASTPFVRTPVSFAAGSRRSTSGLNR